LSTGSTSANVLGVPTPAGTPRPTAEAITAVIAERVRSIRDSAGMSQSALAGKVAELGIPWKRSTVVNLETRAPDSRGRGAGRDVVTVQELLALAVALDVPPVWLLADPKSEEPVAVAVGGEREIKLVPWSALLWMIGREPLAEVPGARYAEARAALVELQRVAQTLSSIRAVEEVRAGGHGLLEGGDRRAEDERLLQALQRPLELLAKWGYPAPPLPADVLHRAQELNIDLPGTAEEG
jgi:transcriptional regulator with XRE-family HTH domain